MWFLLGKGQDELKGALQLVGQQRGEPRQKHGGHAFRPTGTLGCPLNHVIGVVLGAQVVAKPLVEDRFVGFVNAPEVGVGVGVGVYDSAAIAERKATTSECI